MLLFSFFIGFYALIKSNTLLTSSLPAESILCFRYKIRGNKKNFAPSTVKSPKGATPATNLQMGVPTFCKAFPWHFVIDRRLELVQLGAGFMRVFGCMLTTHGTTATTYFEFHRPKSLTLSFKEIVKRANTPFVLAIKKLSGVNTFPAEVSRQKYLHIFIENSYYYS